MLLNCILVHRAMGKIGIEVGRLDNQKDDEALKVA